MGTSQRIQPDSKEALNKPGPGHYEVKSTLNNKAHTFAGKYEISEDNQSPGPGAYDVQNQKIRNSSTSAFIGTEKR